MNIFEQAIQDIFNVNEFKQNFTTQDGRTIVCIAYSTDTDTLYTEYGVNGGVSFHLTCKVKDYLPQKGNVIAFRNKKFKIDSFSADSFNLTYNLFLKDLTSK